MTTSKRFLIILTVVAALPLFALAQDNATPDNTNSKRLTNEYRAARTNETRLTALRELGESMIDRRLTALSKAKGLLEGATRISETTRTSLLAVITDNSSRLADLKTDIQVETDLTVLKTLVQSIVVDYRIYVVVLPQTHGLATADRLGYFGEKVSSLADRVQQKTDELAAEGKDVSEITPLITQAQTKIAEANTDNDQAEAKFAAMKVEDPNGAKTLAQEGKTELQSARTNLQGAWSLLKDAVNAIKGLVK